MRQDETWNNDKEFGRDMKKLLLLLLLIPNLVMAEATIGDALSGILSSLLDLIVYIIDAFQKLFRGDILELGIIQAVLLVLIIGWVINYIIIPLFNSVIGTIGVLFEAVGLTKLFMYLFSKIVILAKKCYELYDFPLSWLRKKADKCQNFRFFGILNFLMLTFLFFYNISVFLLLFGLLLFLAALIGWIIK